MDANQIEAVSGASAPKQDCHVLNYAAANVKFNCQTITFMHGVHARGLIHKFLIFMTTEPSTGVIYALFSRFCGFNAVTPTLYAKIFAAGPFLVDNGVTELQKNFGAFVRRVNKKSLSHLTIVTSSSSHHSSYSTSLLLIIYSDSDYSGKMEHCPS